MSKQNLSMQTDDSTTSTATNEYLSPTKNDSPDRRSIADQCNKSQSRKANNDDDDDNGREDVFGRLASRPSSQAPPIPPSSPPVNKEKRFNRQLAVAADNNSRKNKCSDLEPQQQKLMDFKPVDEKDRDGSAERNINKTSGVVVDANEQQTCSRLQATNASQQVISQTEPQNNPQQQPVSVQSVHALRESTPPSQILSSWSLVTGGSMRPTPNSVRRTNRHLARLRHSIALSHRRLERHRLRQQMQRVVQQSLLTQSQNQSSPPNQQLTQDGIMAPSYNNRSSYHTSPNQQQTRLLTNSTISTMTTTTSIGNSAVRALFRDHLQMRREQIAETQPAVPDYPILHISGSSCSSDSREASSMQIQDTVAASRDHHQQHHMNHRQQLAVADASRRLIERQIDMIRNADALRWNFDFRGSRPLNRAGHRYEYQNVEPNDDNDSEGGRNEESDQVIDAADDINNNNASNNYDGNSDDRRSR